MAIRKAAAMMAAFVLFFGTWAGTALADQPREWQLNLQEAASPLMDRIHSFHTLLLYIIFGVSIFVLEGEPNSISAQLRLHGSDATAK